MKVIKWLGGLIRLINTNPILEREMERTRENQEFDRNFSNPQPKRAS